MNAARRLGTRLGLAAVVAMALGALTMAERGVSAQEDPNWVGWAYFDEVSKCEDRCRLGPSREDTCRCYRMPPIVVRPR